MPDESDVLNPVDLDDLKYAAAILLGVKEQYDQWDKAFADFMFFIMACPDVNSYFKRFIDVLGRSISRPPEMMKFGQGLLMQGNARHCGTYIPFFFFASVFLCCCLINGIACRARTSIEHEGPQSRSLFYAGSGHPPDPPRRRV